MQFVKHAFAILLLAVGVGLTGDAFAANIDKAFRSLTSGATSTTSPGVFESATRGTVVLGGFDMRVPRTTATTSLISVTPPRLDAGCGGISAHFGGFSFINGDEIKNLVRGIAQNAPGLVVNLAMKVMCPQCQAVIEHMTSLAQAAAKVNMDSCQVAADLTNIVGHGLLGVPNPNKGDVPKLTCSSEASASGKSDDFGGAFSSVCTSLEKSIGVLQDKVASVKEKWDDLKTDTDGKPVEASHREKGVRDAQMDAFTKGGAGNKTWLLLSDLNLGSAEARTGNQLLMMNLLGTVTRSVAGGDEKVWPATLDGTTLYHFAMCGVAEPAWMTDPKLNQSYAFMRNSLATFCKDSHQQTSDSLDNLAGLDMGEASKYTIYDCDDKEYLMCINLRTAHIATVPAVMEGSGFLYQVARLLIDSTEAVRNDQAIRPDAIQLMNAAPFPLYQAVNAAAVYPAGATALLGTMSYMVAESLTYTYIDSILKNSVTGEGKPIYDGATYARVAEMVTNFRSMVFQHRSEMFQRFQLQEAINENIRTINQSIQRQVMTEDLINANRFAGVIVSKQGEEN